MKLTGEKIVAVSAMPGVAYFVTNKGRVLHRWYDEFYDRYQMNVLTVEDLFEEVRD